jgi:hypothetical protein
VHIICTEIFTGSRQAAGKGGETGGMDENVANCKEVAPSAFTDFEISNFLSISLKHIENQISIYMLHGRGKI